MRNPFIVEFFYAIVIRAAGKPRPAGLCGAGRHTAPRPFRLVPTLACHTLRGGGLKSVNPG
ncbi:hypothetical protein BLAT2472_40353 [Burkholderia latens]